MECSHRKSTARFAMSQVICFALWWRCLALEVSE